MHSLLMRQLKRHFGESFRIPEQWRDFIRAINDAYGEFDADRELLERSLELSSQELLQTNSEMRAIFQAIPDLLFRLDGTGVIVDYKAGSLDDSSLLPGELVGMRLEELPSIGAGEIFREAIARVHERKTMASIEYSLMAGEQECFFEARFLPLPDDQIIVIIRNITENRKAREELRRSSELYRTIFENTGTASILIAKDTTILLANTNFEKLTGFSKQEMEGNMSWTVFIIEEDLQMMKRYHEMRRKDPDLAPTSYEFRLKNRTGEVRHIFLTVDMIPGTSESIASCLDITERKRAEDELRRSEERYRNILDNMEEAYYEVDLKGDIVFINRATAKLIGYPESEILGRSFRDFMVKEKIKDIYNSFNRVFVTGESAKLFDWEFVRSDNEKLVVEASSYLIRDDQGIPVGFKGIARDVTERKKAEEALRQNEAKYRFMTEKTNDVIWTMDLEFTITFVSSSIEKVLGYTPQECIRRGISSFMTPESFEIASGLLTGELERDQDKGVDPERTVKVDLEFTRKNGSTVWVENLMSAIRDETARITGIHGVSRDITERRRAEEEKKKLESQLAQAQKMESIGTLAGGIAHDFNNILSAIIGFTELAINDITDPERAASELGEVLKAGDRAKDLVSQILTFSRQTEKKHSPLAIQSIIKESLKMIRSLIPSTIELRSDLADSGLVLSDPTQINQVMLNLCTNAVHAMDRTGGVLSVSLKRVHAEGCPEMNDLDLSPGSYMRLTVSDTGHGMSPEVMARIFDPYFTTKEVGRGTGLGLAVVHGIVKSHGGAVTCSSTVGEGTSFAVYYPEIESVREPSRPEDMEPLPTGTERILFVDDEQVLVDLARRMMESLGYTVFTRTSSIEALEFFRNNPDKFDLIITDMTMPGMTGDILTKRVLQIRRDIPVVLCTGYSEYISEERSRQLGIREFIMKPLVMKDLARIIRKVLESMR